jgi:transposase-like protein
MKTKRNWSVEQKLAILKEADEQGVTATICKHQIYGKTLYDWRQKHSTSGTAGLKTSYVRTQALRSKNSKQRFVCYFCFEF